MRLLGVHRLHYRMGGAEAVHLDHLTLFREKGWECAEFAMEHPQNDPSAFEEYFPAYFEPKNASAAARLGAAARFLHSGEAKRKFAALLDAFRPDIIHIHGIYHQLTPAILAPALKRKIPIVYTLHDYKIICPAYNFFRPEVGPCELCRGGRQWNCAIHRCRQDSYVVSSLYALDGFLQWHRGTIRNTVSAFIGPCRFIVDKFVEHGLAREKLHYVPNFFETADDRPVEPSSVEALRQRYGQFLLYFGRLAVEKGLPLLVEAAKQADVTVVFAGEGKEEDALRAQALSLGLRAHFTGHLKGTELWAHVEAARAIALPSICYENAPKSILEAHARGKVVITTAIGGIPEMVEDGVTGFLVPPNDAASLGNAISRVFAASDAERDRIGGTARARVFATFTRDRYFREMSAVYEQLLQRA
ncbi:Glycosyltransferase involved in cell wall bisynthesis [Rhizobiales bacterium GAS188]|nr:Glycosyltransferase involved in cell wall bisynthesis [Rhizobiales bacterium GAS188]